MSEELKRRIELFNEAIMRVARGDYSVQLELSDEYNDLDALAMGLNMMIDELRFNYTIEEENKKIKLLNIQLQEAQRKAEESERLKSAFLANMSHEIRTPMNGILGFAGLLREPHLTDEEQQEYIGIIEKSGARMLNIINDIVSISKVESGQMEVSINVTDINEQIEFIHTFFKPEAEHKGILLNMNKSLSSDEAIIKTDSEKIYAILTTLVKNAIKFTNTGSIEFGYNLISGSYPPELLYYVKDTGVGINPEHQQFIFERFRQSHESLSRKYEGAGLGLTISRAYVEILGGKIWVESEVGQGSTFYFTLPYNTLTEEKKVVGKIFQPQDKENQINPDVSELKVLIAEDDQTSQMLITIDVAKFSKNILKVSTGNEAIEISRNNPDIDLILMDIQMPVMNGYDATRQIRQFNKDVIIIAQTAFGLSGDREKAIQAGCNDYISKPIDNYKLLSLVQKYFKK